MSRRRSRALPRSGVVTVATMACHMLSMAGVRRRHLHCAIPRAHAHPSPAAHCVPLPSPLRASTQVTSPNNNASMFTLLRICVHDLSQSNDYKALGEVARRLREAWSVARGSVDMYQVMSPQPGSGAALARHHGHREVHHRHAYARCERGTFIVLVMCNWLTC